MGVGVGKRFCFDAIKTKTFTHPYNREIRDKYH